MKKIFLLLILTMVETAAAQTFIVKDSRKIDFKNCQENHNRIYDKVLHQNKAQINRVADAIEAHSLSKDRDDKYITSALHRLMVETVVKKVITEKLIEQFNSRSLEQFIQAEGRRQQKLYDDKAAGVKISPSDLALRDFLSYEKLNINMEKEIKDHLADMYKDHMLAVKEYVRGTFKWELTKQIFYASYFNVFAKIGNGLFVQMSGNALKAAVINIGASIFINAAKGTLITILVDPFLGARLPPETEWTDLLKKHNELILVPEWMRKGRVGDGSPWHTHCSAIARRTGFMEDRLKSYLAKDEKIFNVALKSAQIKFEPRDLMLDIRSRTDNTRIKPIIPRYP